MKLLLCTDLDRTLLPNGPEPESHLARKRFCSLAEKEEVKLVYVTGRHKGLVKEAIKNYHIPVPDFVIADVGSTIYEITDYDWHHWQKWEDEISTDWQGKSHADLHDALKDFSELRLQEYHKQNTHKLSYYVPPYVNADSLLEKIEKRIKKINIKANLIWSIDDLKNIGLLDILPASASKRHAIEFLMQQSGFTLEETVFAGDSGNDISVMVSPIHSILVANASNDVKEAAQQEAYISKQQDTVYLAQGNYLGMNGNYSAGILEGIVHYIPEFDEWIRAS